MRRTLIVAASCAALVFTGCAVAAPAGTPTAAAPAASATSVAVTPGRASANPSTSTSATGTPAASASTKGAQRTPTASDTPYTVNGIVLVNRNHTLTKAYVPASAGTQPNGLAPELNAALTRLFADAQARGMTLKVRSGYRSYSDQAASYANALKQYDEATASRYYAKPGVSEHQTGLAADLTNAAGDRGDAFKTSKEAAYLAAHATDFGLIIRYPKDGTDITGYGWEPWHVRYVGPEVASYFAQHPGLTLEEYLGDA